MPFNKGDFTQQGVNGHVNATVRLNEKRLVNIDMTSNEEAEGCTIVGTVTDLLNDKVYPIGAGVSGNIEITENGENINVAPYATATVNVSGGGGLPTMELTLINGANEELQLDDSLFATSVIKTDYGVDTMFGSLEIGDNLNENVLYNYIPAIFDTPEEYRVQFTYLDTNNDVAIPNFTNLVNCTPITDPSGVALKITDPSQSSSATVTLTKGGQ